MHFRIRKHFAYLVIGLLALAGASVCLVGWGGPTTPLSDASGNLDISALQDSFRNPPEDSKIMVRWWWFGPAVTTEELDRELHQMKDAGIGGFEVQPVYPLTLDDPSKGLINLRYLSPEFLAAVSSTARTAHELGLRMDMTMGSGWPFGGPHITPELAAEGLRCLRIPIQRRRPDDPGSAVARPASDSLRRLWLRETGSTSTRVPRIKSTRGRMEAFSFPHLPLFLGSRCSLWRD